MHLRAVLCCGEYDIADDIIASCLMGLVRPKSWQVLAVCKLVAWHIMVIFCDCKLAELPL